MKDAWKFGRCGALVAVGLFVGCGGDTASSKSTSSAKTSTIGTTKTTGEGGNKDAAKTTTSGADKKGDHDHGSGPHGGVVFDLGGGKYHGEFTVSHPKQEATIYILQGGDEKKLAAVKASSMLLNIKEPSFQVELKPVKQSGDAEGTASAFAGKNEKLGKEQEFEGTVSIEIDGKPYAGDFKEVAEAPVKK